MTELPLPQSRAPLTRQPVQPVVDAAASAVADVVQPAEAVQGVALRSMRMVVSARAALAGVLQARAARAEVPAEVVVAVAVAHLE